MAKAIFTSYFAVARKLPADLPQVSIARFEPRFWSPRGGRLTCKLLAPSVKLLQAFKAGDLSREDWAARYIEEVSRADNLERAYESLLDGCVMLCWEADWGGCHRKLAWELLHDHFGVTGGELKVG
ncbi:MAG: DUF488 family protein [Phycisphaerae bacterium]|jgi:uncharacterized protein YeaO (DUF488 family)